MSLLSRVNDWSVRRELKMPRYYGGGGVFNSFIWLKSKSRRKSCHARDHSLPHTYAPFHLTRSLAVTRAFPYRLWVISFPMKRVRLQQWGGSVLCPRTRPTRSYDLSTPLYSLQRCRHQTTASISSSSLNANDVPPSVIKASPESIPQVRAQSRSRSSAKLAALHARLSLPQKVPLETLARTLIDGSVRSHSKHSDASNASLAILGGELLSYYTSEYIIAQYPRLPLAVVFAAMYAYCGPKALAAITREWGVEHAAYPGREVDPGYLQFERVPPQPKEEVFKLGPDTVGVEGHGTDRKGISSRAVRSNEFGDVVLSYHSPEAEQLRKEERRTQGVTAEQASTNFVRALVGAIHLHAGRAAAKQFFKDHFRSRQLNMSSLFQFKNPSKDLTMLCRREGFQPPVARILAETGRKSRHPVYVVGVFSGNDKLGEGAGASLDEAKMRSCVAALKGWYLYSPLEVRVPSDMEEPDAKPWQPILVDSGDVVV
jgi:dsRNA-specific ribonuclease